MKDIAITFTVTLGALFFIGVPRAIQTWGVQRNAPAIALLKADANEARAQALKEAIEGERTERARAKGALAGLRAQLATDEQMADNAEKQNKAAIDRHRGMIKAMTPHGADLLLDASLDPRDLIEKVVLDGLDGKAAVTSVKVTRTANGCALEVTCRKGFNWSQQTQLMEGFKQIRATLDPSWITSVTFGILGGKEPSIPVGTLESLDERRLSAFLSTYYGTKAARLPDPDVIGRRNHADAAWVITNSTGLVVVVDYFGASQGSVTLRVGRKKEIRLTPGLYHISARATSGNVRPFTGQSTYKGGYAYRSTWVIETTNDIFGGAFPRGRWPRGRGR